MKNSEKIERFRSRRGRSRRSKAQYVVVSRGGIRL